MRVDDREPIADYARKLRLSEQESLVFQRLDEAFDLYRRMPDLTEVELATLSVMDHMLPDMLAARAVERSGREDVAQRAVATTP